MIRAAQVLCAARIKQGGFPFDFGFFLVNLALEASVLVPQRAYPKFCWSILGRRQHSPGQFEEIYLSLWKFYK